MKTEKEFSKTLKQLLLWKYNNASIEYILKDYEEYFAIGKSFGKSEERICAELGSPLAVVREVDLVDPYEGYLRYIFNKKVIIRFSILLVLITLFMWNVYKGVWTQLEYKRIFILYPIISILGWYILGGKLFSLAWLGQVKDRYRAIKITIIHSIYLIMNIVSSSLMAKVFSSWDIVYAYNSVSFNELKAKMSHVLLITLIIVAVIMVIGIYEYRYHGIEYYSVVCHGIGIICTILLCMNIWNESEYWQVGIGIIIKYEGIYVESIILSSLFLLYSQYIKE